MAEQEVVKLLRELKDLQQAQLTESQKLAFQLEERHERQLVFAKEQRNTTQKLFKILVVFAVLSLLLALLGNIQ